MNKNRMLSYLRNCLADGNRMNINPNRLRDAITIENHNLEEGTIPKNETRKAFKLWQQIIKKDKKIDEDSSKRIGVAPIVVSPFYIVPSVEHGEKYKSRNPMPVYPLWIPGLLNRDGRLLPPTESKPWISRSVLEPLYRARVSVVLSSVDSVDDFLTHSEIPRESWQEYWDYCRSFFKTVTGKNWAEIKEQNYVSANKVKLIVDTEHSIVTVSILNIYDYLREEDDLPELFNSYISVSPPPLKSLLTNSKMESMSLQHVGHMGNEFSLSDSQRQVLYHLFTVKNGGILSVTGPPGTGKTTLIQNVVANLFVESALEGKEPPIIVAASNNNQAIANILETFGRAQSNSDGLYHRWLPNIEGYGLYLPSQKHGLTKRPHCASITGEGLPKSIETKEYFDVAKKDFLEKCGKFASKVFKTPKLAVEWLHENLKEHKKIIDCGLESWDVLKKVHFKVEKLGGIKTLNESILNIEEKKKKTIANGECVNLARSNLLDAEKNVSFFSKLFFFLTSVKNNRVAKHKMIFSDFPFSTDGLNWLELSELYGFIDHSIKDIKNQAKEINKTLKNYTSLSNEYKAAYQLWNTWKENQGYKENFPELNNEIDVTLRYRAFHIATHYWEGCWLLECQKLLVDFEKSHPLREHEKKWRRYAMLTPCFVSTFYTLSKFFSYPIRSDAEAGYTLIPNLKFIDLLIVDEAGQVSPEIGAPSFALAKKALVLGDIHQIEPIWSISNSVDIGNLEKSRVIADGSNPDQIQEIENRGLCVSKGSVMAAAQAASHFKLKNQRERGLFLSEHRRCDPEIISYCNELAYQGALIPLRPAPENRIYPPFGYAHIHGVSFRRSGSRENSIEAEGISQWLKTNKEKIENHYHKKIEETLGIITPFAAQAGAIRRALKNYGVDAKSITVGTVHALQGAEREIIIFSPCYDYSDRRGRLFFDRGINMLNVAVSRAKDSFFVFGEMSLFDPSSKTPSGMLAHYLFKSEENFIADVPPPLRSKESYKTRINTLEDHQKVLSDSIEQARNSIVIVSPFISIHAIERDQLIPKISAAIKRKVDVVVYTDSFLDKSGLSLKNSAKRGRKALTDAGVKLKIVNGIHNKTLCRDDDLLVEGSFNWLSAIRDLDNEYRRHEVSLCYQGKEVKSLIDEVLEEMKQVETNRNNRK